jgi:hypothetical protein
MKLHLARYCGLAVAFFGLAISANADSIYGGEVSKESGQGNANFEVRAEGPQFQASSVRTSEKVCCFAAGTLQVVAWEDAPVFLETQRNSRVRGAGAQQAVSDTALFDPRNATVETQLGSEYSPAEVILPSAYGFAAGGFWLRSNNDATNAAGVTNSSGQISAPASGSSVLPEGPAATGLEFGENHKDGNPVPIDKFGSGRGVGGSPPATSAAFEVTEPAILALLASGLALMGLLLLKKSAVDLPA